MLDFEPINDFAGLNESDSWIRGITSEDRNARARRFLERQLLVLKPGEALPSIRAIREECGIGINQVQTLINELESSGWVERKDRSGIFKTDVFDSESLIKRIDFIACARIDSLRASPFLSELVHVMSDMAKNHYGRELCLKQVWANQDVRSYESMACNADVRAVILAGSPLMGISEIFTRHNIAVVELLPVYPVSSVCNVPAIVAPGNVVKPQLEHLFSLGHRRIAYLENFDPRAPSWQMMCRREEFYRTMAEAGCKVDSSMVFYPGIEDSQVCKSLEEKFSGKDFPTGFIIYDRHINGFYQWAMNKHLEIGKDVSVVSTDDMPQASQMSPPVTSLRISRKKIAELVFDTLSSVLRGNDATEIIEVPAELIVRRSTGPATRTT